MGWFLWQSRRHRRMRKNEWWDNDEGQENLWWNKKGLMISNPQNNDGTHDHGITGWYNDIIHTWLGLVSDLAYYSQLKMYHLGICREYVWFSLELLKQIQVIASFCGLPGLPPSDSCLAWGWKPPAIFVSAEWWLPSGNQTWLAVP